MASSLAISRITWILLGVVTIAVIVSVTSLVIVIMDRSNRIADLERQLMKGENDKRFADLERQMLSSTKQGYNDKQWKDRISSLEMKMSRLENLTEHTPPGMVAFSVASSKTFTSTDWARIPMEIDIYNPTGYFGNDNAFHAPMKGVYSFHFGAMANWGKAVSIHLYTQKLGETKVHVARAYDYVATGHGGAAGSVMVQMDRGETASVWLWGRSDSNTVLFGHTAPTEGSTTLFMGKLEYQLD